MKTLLKDYWLVWRMALSARSRADVLILGFTAFLTLLVAFLVMVTKDDAVLAASTALRVAVGGAMMGWLLYFVPGAVKLNTPSVACLVPRLRRRLIESTVLAWICIIAFATLVSLGTKLSPALVLLATGTWLAAYGLGQSGHRGGSWMQVAFAGVFFFSRSLPPALVEGIQHGIGFAIACLLMLAFGAYALQHMFMAGGDRHYVAREAQALQLERTTAAGQFKERKQNRFDASLYRWVLARDTAARNSARLLVHLLGARNHWVNRAVVLVSILALAGVALLIMRANARPDTQQLVADLGWLFALPLLLGAVFDSEKRNVRLKDTAGEQALLRLVPPLPAGASAFNRKVAVTLLRTALLEWAMLAGAVLCLGMMTGASAANLFKQACLCCLTLPLVAATLRDHAHRSGLLGWRLLLGFTLSFGASLAVGVALERASGLPYAAGAALASVAITAALVARAFRRVKTAPYAFPAGRLA